MLYIANLIIILELMKLTSTLQNHLRVAQPIFDLLWQVSRFAKDLYNTALYTQRQQLIISGKTLSLGKLFQRIKTTPEYRKLPSDQDFFGCGLRRRANRRHRGLYHCIRCSMHLNADVNGALNIMRKVAPEHVLQNIRWSSGEITSPSRIRLVEFV